MVGVGGVIPFPPHPAVRFHPTSEAVSLCSLPIPSLPRQPRNENLLAAPPPPSPTGGGVCVCVYVPPPPTHPRPARLRAAHSQLQPLFHALQATEPRFLLSWLRMTHFLPFPFPLPFSTHTPPPNLGPLPPSSRPHAPGTAATPQRGRGGGGTTRTHGEPAPRPRRVCFPFPPPPPER